MTNTAARQASMAAHPAGKGREAASLSLIKDPRVINEAARGKVCRDALALMGPRVELNAHRSGALASTGGPLVRFGDN